MGLSEICYKLMYPDLEQSKVNSLVELNMGYDDKDAMDMVRRGKEEGRIPCWINDDMEVSFGKHRSYDNSLREVAYFMQTVRPYVAVFLGTMPDLGQLALCWRELFMFEIKVPFRGYIEIQQIKRWSDFSDPTNPRSRLEYKGEQPFPMANQELQQWYLPWRDKRVMQHHQRLMEKYYPEPKQEAEKPEDQDMISQYARALSMKAIAKRKDNAQQLKEYKRMEKLLKDYPKEKE
jgi:hypothetical protein